MKEVKFRGVDIANNRWLYGNLEIPLINQSKSKHFIIGYAYGQYQKLEVNPKTVGQYTGLKDKNGKEIYEGDIVRFHYKTGVYKIGTVVWNDLFGSWDIDCPDFVSYKSLGQYKSVSEVIGNIYEHKHLLEGTE